MNRYVELIESQQGSPGTQVGGGERAAFTAARWLSFAATPVFAGMALLTGVFDGGQPDFLCSAGHHGSFFGGMVPMYLLMSAVHSAPWLKLILSR
jgi:hypothetical protein